MTFVLSALAIAAGICAVFAAYNAQFGYAAFFFIVAFAAALWAELRRRRRIAPRHLGTRETELLPIIERLLKRLLDQVPTNPILQPIQQVSPDPYRQLANHNTAHVSPNHLLGTNRGNHDQPLAISDRELAEIIGQARTAGHDPRVGSQRRHRYPGHIDADNAETQLAFVILSRDYRNSPTRQGLHFCKTLAKTIIRMPIDAPNVGNSGDIERILIRGLSYEERIAWIFRRWQFDTAEIAAALRLSRQEVNSLLRGLDELLKETNTQTIRLLRKRGHAEKLPLNLGIVLDKGCIGWINTELAAQAI